MSLVRELFFPPKCVACGTLLEWSEENKGAFCKSCKAVWSSERQETCGFCAKSVSQCRCTTELLQKAGCDVLCKAVYYLHGKSTPVQNRLIFSIKRNRTERMFRFLAQELSESVLQAMEEQKIDPTLVCLTYVPRRRGAYLEYGVDQAKALAGALSKELSIPCEGLLKRNTGKARAQKRLSGRERLLEVKRAYAPDKRASVRGRDIILVDDMVTTGATMAACVRILRKAGARHVLCVSAAVDDTHRDPIPENSKK